jgi:hypothetical protein
MMLTKLRKTRKISLPKYWRNIISAKLNQNPGSFAHFCWRRSETLWQMSMTRANAGLEVRYA